jgi:hypothetical protein
VNGAFCSHFEILQVRDRELFALPATKPDWIWCQSMRTCARLALLACVRPQSPYASFDRALLPVYRQTFAKGWAAQTSLPENEQMLPRDCFLYIFLCTDADTLASCRCVCRTWWMWIEDFEATTKWRQKKRAQLDAVAEARRIEEELSRRSARRYGSRDPSPARPAGAALAFAPPVVAPPPGVL